MEKNYFTPLMSTLLPLDLEQQLTEFVEFTKFFQPTWSLFR